MMKINEKILRRIIAKSINEALDANAPQNNILISDKDIEEIESNFPGVLNRGMITRKPVEWIYADGEIERDMGGTDYFYVINPQVPNTNTLPFSFYGWYKGRKVIICRYEAQGGLAVYADDKAAVAHLQRNIREVQSY